MEIFQINPTRFCWTVLPPIALSPCAKKYFEVKYHNIYYNGRVSSSKKYKSELFIKNQSIVVWWAGPWKHGLSKYLCIPGWGAEDFDKICKNVIEEFEKTKYKLLSNFSSLCFMMGILAKLVVVSTYTTHVQFMYCNASIKHSLE